MKRDMDPAACRNRVGKGFWVRLLTAIILIGFGFPPVCTGSQVESGTDSASLPSPASAANRLSSFELRQYAGLPELVTEVCREAEQFFRDFYGPTVVTVQPFVFLTGSGDKKFSPFGASLADQMIAMINNQSAPLPPPPDEAAGQPDQPELAGQELKGVLFEMDGYLHVHMLGVNEANQRRSYTANIEMSEALYRSLYADTF